MTVFGESKKIYDVERGSSFLDSASFYKLFSPCDYKVFVLKGRLIISKNKIIETEGFAPIWCQCFRFFCKLSFTFSLFLKISKSKS